MQNFMTLKFVKISTVPLARLEEPGFLINMKYSWLGASLEGI